MTDWDVAYWKAKYNTLKEYCTNLNCQYAAALSKIAELEDRLPEPPNELPKFYDRAGDDEESMRE